jgi:hypothetical protein
MVGCGWSHGGGGNKPQGVDGEALTAEARGAGENRPKTHQQNMRDGARATRSKTAGRHSRLPYLTRYDKKVGLSSNNLAWGRARNEVTAVGQGNLAVLRHAGKCNPLTAPLAPSAHNHGGGRGASLRAPRTFASNSE